MNFSILKNFYAVINIDELLMNYKKNRKYPKGMSLIFNLSLCCENKKLQNDCNNILRDTSFKLRDTILNEVRKKVEDINIQRNEKFKMFKDNLNAHELVNIRKFVESKIKKLTSDIKASHQRKYERDNIQIFTSNCRNRRFRKNKRIKRNNERKKGWHLRQIEIIKNAKANCPDQNAINLSTLELSDDCRGQFQPKRPY